VEFGLVIDRKIQLVYLYWGVIPIFFALLLLGLRHLIRRGKNTRNVLTPATVVFLILYSAFGGYLPFFNKVGFYHYMLDWNLYDRIPYMLQSMGIAFIPSLLVFVLRCLRTKSFNADGDVLVSLFPIVHSAMAVVYIFFAPYVIE